MGKIVNVIEEIRDRLATAQSSGTLTFVKRVLVGSVEEARKQTDFPIINIDLISGNDDMKNNSGLNTSCSDTVSIEVRLIHNKLSEPSNVLYKTSGSTGIIFAMEQVRNVLDKNTGGTQDIRLNNTTYNLRRVSYSINYLNAELIEAVIKYDTETVLYTPGSL